MHWSPAYTIRSEPDITQCSPEVSRIYPSASGGNHQAFTFTPHVMPPSAAPRAGSRNITACASRRQALQWPQGGDPHRSASVILLGYRVKEITLAARSIKILPQLQQHGLNQRPQRLRNPVPPKTRNAANPFTKATSGQVLGQDRTAISRPFVLSPGRWPQDRQRQSAFYACTLISSSIL